MKLILIGSSTGGPNQLKFLLKDIDVKNTCVVIAQHMSASFIPSFVGQFNKILRGISFMPIMTF